MWPDKYYQTFKDTEDTWNRSSIGSSVSIKPDHTVPNRWERRRPLDMFEDIRPIRGGENSIEWHSNIHGEHWFPLLFPFRAPFAFPPWFVVGSLKI